MTWTDLYFRMFVLTAETEPTAVRETGLGSVQPWVGDKGGSDGGEGPGPRLNRGLL